MADSMIAAFPERMTASACFGPPVQVDGQTVIPVARVAVGFGLGSGKTPDGPSGGGGGGGGKATPVAVVSISAHGAEVRPIIDVTRIALSGMAMVGWSVFWIARAVRARRPR